LNSTVWASIAVIRLIVPAYGATPHGASPSTGYAFAAAGPWLVAGAAELGDVLGVLPAQALKTIATAPNRASGDSLLVWDMP
jgi:hypothetical protein